MTDNKQVVKMSDPRNKSLVPRNNQTSQAFFYQCQRQIVQKEGGKTIIAFEQTTFGVATEGNSARFPGLQVKSGRSKFIKNTGQTSQKERGTQTKVHRRGDKVSPNTFKKRKHLNWGFILSLPLLPIILGVWLFFLREGIEPLYHSELDLEPIRQELSKQLFGQSEASETVLTIIQDFNKNCKKEGICDQPPVILLTGGNGVGKTFMASILVKHFPGQAEFHFSTFLPSLNEVLSVPSTSGQHLLVLDNSSAESAPEILKWTESVRLEATSKKRIIWILLVFNVQPQNYAKMNEKQFKEELDLKTEALNKTFSSANFATHLVQFKSLDKLSVRKCAKKVLLSNGFFIDTMSKDEQDNFLNALSDVEEDKYEGCKKINTRMITLRNVLNIT